MVYYSHSAWLLLCITQNKLVGGISKWKNIKHFEKHFYKAGFLMLNWHF